MNLNELLREVAETTVPEADPLGERLGAIRSRVRHRRTVNRVGSSAVGMVGVAGVAAIGTLTWQAAQPEPPASPAGTPWEYCDLSVADVVGSTSAPSGPASLTMVDGMQLAVATTVTNPGSTQAQAAPAQLVVYLFGGGDIVGLASAGGTEPTTLGPGASDVVAALGTVGACASGSVSQGDPLPDGRYGVMLTGDLTPDGGDWHSDAVIIDVTGGQIAAVTDDPDPTADPDASAGGYTPVCGEVTPAVGENPLYVTLGTDAGPHQPGDPDHPGTDGLSLDLTVGSVNAGHLTGTAGAETVTMITDLDGRVRSWWRATGGSPSGAPLDLPADGSQLLPAAAWHPLTDTCTDTSTEGRLLPDGDYRVFVAVGFGIDAPEHPATWEVLSAPLELTVTGGGAAVTGGRDAAEAVPDAGQEFPGALPPDFPEGELPLMDGVLLGSGGNADTGWTISGDYGIHGSSIAALDQAIERLVDVGFTLESRVGPPEADGAHAVLQDGMLRVEVEVTGYEADSLPGGYTIQPIDR
ncbi:hypothetical protein OCAE111667_24430 [Occultella aeris]|uniref:Uncharacterized protein n=1 Tax=Occultella aeris TaxID=2761496 RepID=A0A7M4DLF4_9MICO|nr:hypothetical protein [Occultella aeris]VZO38090.1 hypothetical protein HALOF300_02971 [Occultella aeris]